MIVVLSLIGITCSLLLYVYIKDETDERIKQYTNVPEYDLIQSYLIVYNKEKFNKNYSLLNLFSYMIKVNI